MSSPGNLLPVNFGPEGPQPTSPAALQQQLLAGVSAEQPGYTAALPGILIEDISSTCVGALVLVDAYRVELLNSLAPLTANQFTLIQLGNIYGVTQVGASFTSVYVVFTGTVGFNIGEGFLVGDGTYQYSVQDPVVIPASCTTGPVFCLATTPGIWAVPVNTVTQLATTPPSTITLSVTNPATGVPGTGSETVESFQAGVMQAGLAASQGMTTYLKTQLRNVPGVQSRLVSARQNSGWEILVGGGDPYAVANAIFESLFNINDLVPSTILVTGITQAVLGVVTTAINHGLTNGQSNVFITGVVGMTSANGGPYTVQVISPNSFTFGVNTSGFGAYVSGGSITPNARNVSISIHDYPDTYVIPIVVPLQQTVTMTVTWNTNSPNYVNPASISQYAAPALVNYVNSIAPGQPMNVFVMNTIFQEAVAPVLDSSLLDRLVFSVAASGVTINPSAGTGLLVGDPESYFFATAAGIVINQG